MSDEVIKTLMAERTFLESQLRKLTGIIHRQEEEIADLRSVNQDLKFQLTQKHEQLNLKNEIDQIDDGRC
jgi:TolA-binding protein